MKEQVEQDVMVGWESPGGDRALRIHDSLDGLQSIAPKSPAEWIGEIQRRFAEGRSTTMKLSRIVCAAKRSLHYGQWTEMWKSARLPFGKRKAEMLVVIGNNLGPLDAHNCARLPSALHTLYCLARLDPSTLNALIGNNIIHPGLTLREAKALLGKPKHQSNTDQSRRPNVKRRLRQFRDFVCDTVDHWLREERDLATIELTRLIENIEAASETLLVAKTATRLASQFSFPVVGRRLIELNNVK